MVDPHTAVAIKVSKEFKTNGGKPMLVTSTIQNLLMNAVKYLMTKILKRQLHMKTLKNAKRKMWYIVIV